MMQQKNMPSLDYKTMQLVLQRLISIIQEESLQIKHMKVLHLSGHAEEKRQLHAYLEGCKQLIIKHPQVLNEIPKEARGTLKSLSLVFEQEMAFYHKQLLKIRKVQSLLMGMVQNSMKKKLLTGGYTRAGMMDDSYNKEVYTPPVSLNQDC